MYSGILNEAIESNSALIVTDSATGSVIGSTRFHGYNPEESEVEIG